MRIVSMRRVGAVAFLGIGLAGCGGSSLTPDLGGAEEGGLFSTDPDFLASPALRYRAPVQDAAGPARATIAAPWRDAVLAAAEGLRDEGLRVALVEPTFAIAQYSGDAGAYVDCGQVFAGSREVAATTPRLAADRPIVGYRGGSSERLLELDARVTVASRPEGDATQLRADVDYVLTKTVTSFDANGFEIGKRVEVADFESGGEARFRNGVRCVATGALEQAAVAPSAQALTARSVQPAAGLAANCLPTASDARRYCEALAIADFLANGPMDVEINERRSGDVVTLDVRSNDVSGEFYLLHVKRDGRVDHLAHLFLDGLTPRFLLPTSVARGDVGQGDLFLAVAARDKLYGGVEPRNGLLLDNWLTEFKDSIDAQPGVVTGAYAQVGR